MDVKFDAMARITSRMVEAFSEFQKFSKAADFYRTMCRKNEARYAEGRAAEECGKYSASLDALADITGKTIDEIGAHVKKLVADRKLSKPEVYAVTYSLLAKLDVHASV